ncbi:MAG: hypothetical protein PUD92_01575 [Clostridiales bacterium]|nr:hypothetical protein [Clostridiales bacterium]
MKQAIYTCFPEDMVYNPNAIPVWLSVDGKMYKIEPGASVNI